MPQAGGWPAVAIHSKCCPGPYATPSVSHTLGSINSSDQFAPCCLGFVLPVISRTSFCDHICIPIPVGTCWQVPNTDRNVPLRHDNGVSQGHRALGSPGMTRQETYSGCRPETRNLSISLGTSASDRIWTINNLKDLQVLRLAAPRPPAMPSINSMPILGGNKSRQLTNHVAGALITSLPCRDLQRGTRGLVAHGDCRAALYIRNQGERARSNSSVISTCLYQSSSSFRLADNYA